MPAGHFAPIARISENNKVTIYHYFLHSQSANPVRHHSLLFKRRFGVYFNRSSRLSRRSGARGNPITFVCANLKTIIIVCVQCTNLQTKTMDPREPPSQLQVNTTCRRSMGFVSSDCYKFTEYDTLAMFYCFNISGDFDWQEHTQNCGQTAKKTATHMITRFKRRQTALCLFLGQAPQAQQWAITDELAKKVRETPSTTYHAQEIIAKAKSTRTTRDRVELLEVMFALERCVFQGWLPSAAIWDINEPSHTLRCAPIAENQQNMSILDIQRQLELISALHAAEPYIAKIFEEVDKVTAVADVVAVAQFHLFVHRQNDQMPTSHLVIKTVAKNSSLGHFSQHFNPEINDVLMVTPEILKKARKRDQRILHERMLLRTRIYGTVTTSPDTDEPNESMSPLMPRRANQQSSLIRQIPPNSETTTQRIIAAEPSPVPQSAPNASPTASTQWDSL